MVKTLRLPAALWGKPLEASGVAPEHCLLAVHALFTAEARQALEQHLGLGCFAWHNRASGGQHAPCFVYIPLGANHGAVLARLVDDGVHEGRPHHLRIEAVQLSSDKMSHETIAGLLHPTAWMQCSIDPRQLEAELYASVAPEPWQRTVLAALVTYSDQSLLVTDHGAFSIKANSGLRIIRVTATPPDNVVRPMALENQTRVMVTHTPPTTEGSSQKRDRSRGVVVAVTCSLILAGLLLYSGWQWWRMTQDVKYLNGQIKKLEAALASEQTDKERLQREHEASVIREKATQQDISDLRASNKQWELAARAFGAHNAEELDQRVKEIREKEDQQLTRLRDAIVRRDAWFQDRYRLWLQLRDQFDKLFSEYGGSDPRR